jgi:hypothetical protein
MVLVFCRLIVIINKLSKNILAGKRKTCRCNAYQTNPSLDRVGELFLMTLDEMIYGCLGPTDSIHNGTRHDWCIECTVAELQAALHSAGRLCTVVKIAQFCFLTDPRAASSARVSPPPHVNVPSKPTTRMRALWGFQIQHVLCGIRPCATLSPSFRTGRLAWAIPVAPVDLLKPRTPIRHG